MDYTHSLKSERTVYEFLPHVDRNEIGESPPPPFQCDAVAFCSERIKDRLTTAAAAGPEKEIYCIATSFPFPPRIFREIGSSIAAAADLGRRRIITEAINRQRGDLVENHNDMETKFLQHILERTCFWLR